MPDHIGHVGIGPQALSFEHWAGKYYTSAITVHVQSCQHAPSLAGRLVLLDLPCRLPLTIMSTAHIPRCREEEESEEDARERARLRNAEAAAEAAARKERRRKAAEKKAEQKGRAHAQRAAAARAGGPGAGKEDEAAAAGGAVVSVGLLLQVGVKFACRDLLGV